IRKKYCAGPEMRKIQLSMPNVLGASTVKPTPKPVTAETPTPGTVPAADAKAPSPQSPFPGNGTVTPPTTPALPLSVQEKGIKTYKIYEPSLAVNLTGAFEKWGVSSDSTLKSTKIEFTDLSVNQVKQILMRIPSSIKASLEVTYEEEDGK
ncbi:MAG: hypothetical protein JW902_12120, partial [Syntrophaceae bacterium]|nr:hypothetical protein [Syntrophaceae bacterium]